MSLSPSHNGATVTKEIDHTKGKNTPTTRDVLKNMNAHET